MNDPSMNRLVEQVRRTSREYHLWSPGDCIIVAVSGGPDSVALLHILNQLARDNEMCLNLVCAHVNHGFRGLESDKEAEFVAEIAAKLDIPFELGSFDVPAYMKETGKGTQLAAREKRYEFLHSVADKYGAKSIALAHHADDQAETVMMRLLRGSGPTGLAGMKITRHERNVELIRPLLRIYKTELVRACQSANIPYVTDSSNLLNKYDRNAVRLDVLPFLGQYNGQLVASLNRLAEVIGDEDDYMQQEVVHVYDNLVSQVDGGLAFKVPQFASLHAALQRRLIKLILDYLPFNMEESDFVKIEAIRKGTVQNRPTTWSLDLGGGLCCLREYDIIRFVSNVADRDLSGYSYSVDPFRTEVPIPWAGHRLHFLRSEAEHIVKQSNKVGKDEAVFDADQLVYPLTVRSRLPGDIMRVMGLDGSKKVKDIFIDEKIPPSLRSQIPIVSDAEGRILWIAGIRRSTVAMVTQHTSSVMRITLVAGSE
ncbi:tRNA lysidine(34) synthetase TilS [Paenibacillus anaericanus]|uniref:tRNA(Ile)-lysidine synthase n=1 Tax=Paenibacillus anaericanus TaxID=170367 RepID=A0A3S1BIS6_9BACL|nr:tRNA lysidine(34) synthetase TilS [Paenibacillus anaericanus]RUT42596.1 tRNA lysidine(34) synthetase TilS [Paenibacillus anaericanus]